MELHLFQEILCVLMGLSVFGLSLKMYRQNRELKSLFWFSTWGALMGGLTLVHILFSYFSDNPSFWITFTYLPERIADPVIVMLCVYSGNNGHSFEKRFKILKLTPLMYALVCVYGSLLCPMMIRDGMLIGRPQALLSVVVAAIIFGRMIDTYSAWGRILKWQVCASMISGIVIMFSTKLFDTAFVISHNCKMVSYIIVLNCSLMLYSHNCKKASEVSRVTSPE